MHGTGKAAATVVLAVALAAAPFQEAKARIKPDTLAYGQATRQPCLPKPEASPAMLPIMPMHFRLRRVSPKKVPDGIRAKGSAGFPQRRG